VADQFDPLDTPRLHLEPVSPDVAVAIVAGDLRGLQPGEGWPHSDTKDGMALAAKHGHPAAWLVTLDGRVIGDCGTHGPVDGAGAVEIGYGLAHPYRGQGFGTEVVLAMSAWLLAQPGVVSVRARTLAANVASRRVLEKSGFQITGGSATESIYELRLR